jgi:NAD-reducing hydrogenase large subunit
MPLSVTLRDARGAVLDHVLRSSTGETRRGATAHPLDQAR